jgi:hypothetical protein
VRGRNAAGKKGKHIVARRAVKGRCSKTSKKDLLVPEILKIGSTLPGFEGPGNFWRFHYVRRMRNSPDRFGTNKR